MVFFAGKQIAFRKEARSDVSLSQATQVGDRGVPTGSVFCPLGRAENSHWKPQRLCWTALLMSISEGQTLTHRFEHSCEFLHDTHRHWKMGNSYSGFTQALAKASPWLPQAIQTRLQKCMLERAGEHARV